MNFDAAFRRGCGCSPANGLGLKILVGKVGIQFEFQVAVMMSDPERLTDGGTDPQAFRFVFQRETAKILLNAFRENRNQHGIIVQPEVTVDAIETVKQV